MTGQSDWQTDGEMDSKRLCEKLLSCETWASVDLKQVTTLFYSPLGTWASEALCDVCVACLCPCSAVHALHRELGRRWETRQENRGDSWLSFISACSATSILWHVAVLNHRAIIWCQVVQRPQTSVMALCWCAALYLWASAAVHFYFNTRIHSFILLLSAAVSQLFMGPISFVFVWFMFTFLHFLLGHIIEPQLFFWYLPQCVHSSKSFKHWN